MRVLFLLCFFTFACLAESTSYDQKRDQLCVLQGRIADGQHESVRLSGIYGPGLDHTVLEDPSCPAETTWVELDLRSKKNEKKLHALLDRSRRAFVILDGELYGPPLPDPKLPEAIRKNYHPGWGHLAAFKTKLIVHKIVEVKAVLGSSDEASLE